MLHSPPLYVDVSDRRCRRLYLFLAHLIVSFVVLLSSIPPVVLFQLLGAVGVSAVYWWNRERSALHPETLKWNETLNWRLESADGDLPIVSIRHLQTPICILLEIRGSQGVELLFLRNQPELNQLRYQLRREAKQ